MFRKAATVLSSLGKYSVLSARCAARSSGVNAAHVEQPALAAALQSVLRSMLVIVVIPVLTSITPVCFPGMVSDHHSPRTRECYHSESIESQG